MESNMLYKHFRESLKNVNVIKKNTLGIISIRAALLHKFFFVFVIQCHDLVLR